MPKLKSFSGRNYHQQNVDSETCYASTTRSTFRVSLFTDSKLQCSSSVMNQILKRKVKHENVLESKAKKYLKIYDARSSASHISLNLYRWMGFEAWKVILKAARTDFLMFINSQIRLCNLIKDFIGDKICSLD